MDHPITSSLEAVIDSVFRFTTGKEKLENLFQSIDQVISVITSSLKAVIVLMMTQNGSETHDGLN